ncbi:hypothetical protein HETIRDRAFT_448423 [Heterobasidion irregulare TC 32-1]|uniref:Retrovirus-related Pol polyprotein from transposon TNT 1-94-like beta-barrel domain-containing protein n=1 Tax=Heterobasidion irregulare (strain TC 32-1) TaxID=747525 RepID=W4KHF1_HETIT|nr:uncharacterized protein HETIRDRAFT_448423 [Heterobasidion irregulare TC 32-1]ETW85262.1 hypothetical protein HETIRDRAFT_448423 [Heterobasidion irregulare TC 32-1]
MTNAKPNTWVVDLGSSSHVAKWEEMFAEYSPGERTIEMAKKGHTMCTASTGSITISTGQAGKQVDSVWLRNMLHTPDATENLLSMSKLDRAGGSAVSGGGKVVLLNKDHK